MYFNNSLKVGFALVYLLNALLQKKAASDHHQQLIKFILSNDIFQNRAN